MPLAALILVWLVADAALPASNCDGVSVEASDFAKVAALVVIGAASLGACLAAAIRLGSSLRSRDGRGPLAVLLAAAAIVLGALLLPIGGAPVIALFVLGLAATWVALLGLLVMLAAGRSKDRTGPLLPVYLLGCGLFLYPSVLFLFAIGNAGLGC